MKKLILLAILAGLAWWYVDHGRRITEADVRASYEADVDALRRFDGDFLCARISDDFAGTEISRQDGEDFEEHFDKAAQCKRIRRSIEAMQQLSTAAGGRLGLKIDYEIRNIELSSDRKHATVQSVSSAKLGDMTLARDRTTDHLIRRNGHVLSVASETRVWTYKPQ